MFNPSNPTNKFKTLVNRAKGLSRRLNPKVLLRGLYKEAMASARKLGGEFKPDVPDHYVVQINFVDWDEYYGHRRAETEIYLSNRLHAKLSARQRAAGARPTVELAKDYSLSQGEFKVKGSFQGRSPFEPGTAAPLPCEAAPDTASAPRAGKAQARTSEITPTFSGAMATAKTAVMKSDEKVARLMTKTGETIVVHAGDTIGVVRNAGERRPDIRLDESTHRFASQIHGTFSCPNEWVFEDGSKNGTEIRLGREKTVLRKGERTTLKNGCAIVLGHGDPLVFQSF